MAASTTGVAVALYLLYINEFIYVSRQLYQLKLHTSFTCFLYSYPMDGDNKITRFWADIRWVSGFDLPFLLQ